MDIFKKLFTAVRGGTREIGEAIVDSQSMRIFEQEIEDAKKSLEEAKDGLTEVVARKMASERQYKALQTEIAENEGYAAKALDKGDETLALEVAGKIAELEANAAEVQGHINAYETHAATLKQQIHRAEQQIAEHERELTMVKTQESVHKATEAVTQSVTMNQSSLGSARESLERIKKKQQLRQDKVVAGEQLHAEFSGSELDKKLTDAGIKGEASKAEDVLARLKAKQNG